MRACVQEEDDIAMVGKIIREMSNSEEALPGMLQDGVMNILFKLAKMDPGSIKVRTDGSGVVADLLEPHIRRRRLGGDVTRPCVCCAVRLCQLDAAHTVCNLSYCKQRTAMVENGLVETLFWLTLEDCLQVRGACLLIPPSA